MGTTKTKAIFAGIDNAGKTSIILSVQKKFSFLNSLKATFGLNRTALSEIKCLGLDLVAWDLGGQRKFRDEYFKQRFRVFANITTMFYVIDIQDPTRYAETFDYFKDILETFDALQEKPYIIFMINKVDPDIRDTVETQERIQIVMRKANELLNNRFQIVFFQTTIFELTSIMKAFSEGVIKDSPKAKLIGDYLKEYAHLTFSSTVMLLDENSLQVAVYSSKKQYIEICESVAPRFISAMEKMVAYNITPENCVINLHFPDQSTEEGEERDAMVFVKSFKTQQNLAFHLVTLARNKNTYKLSENYLPDFTAHLNELIQALENPSSA